jgi:hypothetical protein
LIRRRVPEERIAPQALFQPQNTNPRTIIGLCVTRLMGLAVRLDCEVLTAV